MNNSDHDKTNKIFWKIFSSHFHVLQLKFKEMRFTHTWGRNHTILSYLESNKMSLISFSEMAFVILQTIVVVEW